MPTLPDIPHDSKLARLLPNSLRIRDGMVIEHIEYMNPLNIIAAYEA